MASTQGIKLDDDIRARLKALGKIRNRSPHWLLREAISSYLEREENYEREKQGDIVRWERYQLTGDAASEEEATVWLNKLAECKFDPCPE